MVSEWFMVCEQGEFSSLQELVKGFDAKHHCQCFSWAQFFSLCVSVREV